MAGMRRNAEHSRLSKDYQKNEIEYLDLVNQVRICTVRNVIEIFSSLGSKIYFCDRLSLLVKDTYIYLISYLSKESHTIKIEFDREEYVNHNSLYQQLLLNGSLLYINEKTQQLKVFSQENADFIDDCETRLEAENYEFSDDTIETCEDIYVALREMNRRADAIIEILQKLRDESVGTFNAIVAFNLHLNDYFKERKDAGNFEEVQMREATRILIFGENGELYNAVFQHERDSAKLLFYRIRLNLENIMDEGEE